MVKPTTRNLAMRHMIAPALAAILAANPAVAYADTVGASEHSDIIVTARKIPESLIKAPVSVTSISSATLEDAGLDSTTDLAALAPNVDISGGIAGQLQGQISIRGISTLVRNIGLETGVGIYVDGVYAGRPENFAQHLLDVERVEIIRGPQGTEFGKNTIAGVIHVQSRQPDAETGASASVGFGNYDYFQTEAAIGGKVTDQISLRGAISHVDRDGFYNHLSGGEDAGSTDLLTWRLSAKLEPSSDLSFTLRGDGLRDRSVPAFFQAAALAGFPPEFPSNQPLRINNNRPNSLSRDNNGASLTVSWNPGALSLTSITAYRESSFEASLDDDQEQVDFVAADDFADDSEFLSQELRASGQHGNLQYLLGAYYFDQTVKTDRKIAVGSDLGIPGEPALTTIGQVKTESFAVFGRLDYQATERLQVSAGLRYTDEKKRAQFVQGDTTGVFTFLGFPNLTFEGRSSDSDVSPTVSVSYELADRVNFYARIVQGFKSAAFNVDLASSLDGLTARPEKATSYEVGLKTSLLDDRVKLNLAAFHTDYSRLQVSEVLGSGLALSNAGKARSRGIESEISFQLSPNLRFEGNAGLLDAEYETFSNCLAPASVGGGVADCSGNALVLAPDFTGHAAIQLDVPVKFGEIFARADLDYRSSVFFEPTNSAAFKGGSRALTNVRVGLKREKWQVIAWVENLTDETYQTYADDRSSLGVLRTAAYGQPRTYGLTLATRF